MYGLDLFSGIGGLTQALDGYAQPIAYCENDRYAQAVLLSHMSDRSIPRAPIWDDVRTLHKRHLPVLPDIVYGGFPCQDISVAGRGVGLEGKRSGLFFEIMRLVGEIRPAFIFLENVAAINRRGGNIVAGALANLGYDCRWDVLSAADVGANHRRERWWLLAHTSGERCNETGARQSVTSSEVADATCGGTRTVSEGPRDQGQGTTDIDGRREDVADTGREHGKARTKKRIAIRGVQENGQTRFDIKRSSEMGHTDGASGSEPRRTRARRTEPRNTSEQVPNAVRKRLEGQREVAVGTRKELCHAGDSGWWAVEPNVGRVANGIPMRVDRLRGLGNAVVPAQAREAFERLMGLK